MHAMADTTPVRARPGRPAQLSRELIVAAALQGNLETLTMRELADRLGVSHAALYRWVDSRDALFDLVSEVMIERILPADEPRGAQWRPWLRRVAWAMHDQFTAVPGYAGRLARPHRHNPEALARLHNAVVRAFIGAGLGPELAEQSWYIFVTCVVGWLATQEAPLNLGHTQPRFELFLDTLLRGLPARNSSQ